MMSTLEKRERMEQEFELETGNQAIEEYANITSVISVNYSLIADELSKFGDFKKGLALDLGTGLGDLAIEIARRYPGLKIIGIDISKKAIQEATNKAKKENLKNIDFQLSDVHNLTFRDNSVDLVVSHGSIHHLKNLSKAFLEIYRILKPGSLAYLTDLRRDAPELIIKEVELSLPSHQARAFINSVNASYIPAELEDILRKLGIKNFSVLAQKFSRDTIIKNINRLRSVSMRKADYTKLSLTILIRKEA